MKSRFSRVFFASLLTVNVLFAVAYAFTPLSEYMGILTTGDVYYYPLYIVALMPLAFWVLAALVSLCYVNLRQPSGGRRNVKGYSSARKSIFSYTLTVYAIVGILLFVFYMLTPRDGDTFFISGNVQLVLCYLGLAVLITILVSALSVSISAVWRLQRLPAAILAAILLAFLSVACVMGVILKEVGVSQRYIDTMYGTSELPDEGEEVEDDYYDEEDDTEEKLQPSILSGLWGVPANDADSVKGAARYLLSYKLAAWKEDDPLPLIQNIGWVLNSLRYNAEEDWSAETDVRKERDRLALRNIYRYLAANTRRLTNVYSAYQQYVHKYVPLSEFSGTSGQWAINALLTAYKDLYSGNDYSYRRIRDVYKLMSTTSHTWLAGYYDDMLKLINIAYLDEFTYEGEVSKEGLIWAYSFWARRHAEGTDIDVYKLLTAVNRYYEKAPDRQSGSGLSD